jgi:hypothetical protein
VAPSTARPRNLADPNRHSHRGQRPAFGVDPSQVAWVSTTLQGLRRLLVVDDEASDDRSSSYAAWLPRLTGPRSMKRRAEDATRYPWPRVVSHFVVTARGLTDPARWAEGTVTTGMDEIQRI